MALWWTTGTERDPEDHGYDNLISGLGIHEKTLNLYLIFRLCWLILIANLMEGRERERERAVP